MSLLAGAFALASWTPALAADAVSERRASTNGNWLSVRCADGEITARIYLEGVVFGSGGYVIDATLDGSGERAAGAFEEKPGTARIHVLDPRAALEGWFDRETLELRVVTWPTSLVRRFALDVRGLREWAGPILGNCGAAQEAPRGSR